MLKVNTEFLMMVLNHLIDDTKQLIVSTYWIAQYWHQTAKMQIKSSRNCKLNQANSELIWKLTEQA